MTAKVPLLLLALAPLGKGFAGGFETIVESDLTRDVGALADPALEGRDTPSRGLARAAEIIAERFGAAGLVAAYPSTAGAEPDTGFRRAFHRRLPEPDPAGCALEMEPGGARALELDLKLGRDFVPVTGFSGDAEGPVVFAGYGIRSKTERYDDLAGLELDKKIVVVVEGEPRHDRKFDGPELSRAASLWDKLDALAESGAAGVLAVRRAAVAGAAPAKEADAISFRATWADWNGVAADPPARRKLPVLEVSLRCAGEILGEDVEALAGRIDRSARPVRAAKSDRRVRMRSRTRETSVAIDNLVGMLPGSDAALSAEFVVVGAHYDHVGIDPRGRIACGADDNASGVAGMLEIAEALAQAGPRRSVLFCAFAGEEDGLLGSQALCGDLPVPKEKLVAMVNMDMIGRGDAGELAVLGIVQNPGLEEVVARARKLRPCGVREVVLREGEELFERSDHFSFHKIGVPALFFFEGLPIDKNKDYHTWRDTVDKLDTKKMLNTTRFVYNATWILTDDDERPPPPRD